MDRGDGDGTGHFAGLVSTHAVRQNHQARLGVTEGAVFIMRTPSAHVRHIDDLEFTGEIHRLICYFFEQRTKFPVSRRRNGNTFLGDFTRFFAGGG